MASACVSEDLTCSVCLSVFTEPVMLLCGHSFCRECISVSLDKQKNCPVCRASVDTGGQSLLTNHVLKSLVEKTKQKLQYRHDKEKAEFLCPDHDEKLKLYCITDQQLTCVICRDSQKHESHKFKPVSEAAALVREELQNLVQKISADSDALETLVQSQREEVDSTKRRSGDAPRGTAASEKGPNQPDGVSDQRSGRSSTLVVQGRPQKIGIYLNCPRKELSFYDADNMAHIHTASLADVSFPVSAFFTLEGQDLKIFELEDFGF